MALQFINSPEKDFSSGARYCKSCKAEHLLTSQFWTRLDTYPQCREYRRNKTRQWKLANPHKKYKNNPETQKAWLQANSVRVKEYESKRVRSLEYKIALRLRQRLNKAIRLQYKSGSAVRDLGCSIEEFKIHLESKFSQGMSWDTYGKWHVDHIRPLASFDLTKQDQLLEACHYTNLQPLWAIDNLKKGAKYGPQLY